MIKTIICGGSEFNGFKIGKRVINKMVINDKLVEVPARVIGFERGHFGDYNILVEVDKKYGTYQLRDVLEKFENHGSRYELELLTLAYCTRSIHVTWTTKDLLRIDPKEFNNNKTEYPQTLTPQQKAELDHAAKVDYIANNPPVYVADNIRLKGFTINNPIHKHENVEMIKGTVGNENYFDNSLNAALKLNKGHDKENTEGNDRKILSAIEEATHFKPSSHYEFGDGLNCMTFIEEAIKDLKGIEAFYVANAIKYLFRTTKKNGDDDLKKAHNYLTLLLKKRGLM